MHTAAAEPSGKAHLMPVLQAADAPVAPIRDYSIPIQPHRHPPTEDDFRRQKERKKRPPGNDDSSQPGKPSGEGHIDDFA